VRGIELAAEVRYGDWRANAGLSLLDARVQAGGLAGALDGLRPAQTPRLSLTTGLGWENGGRTLGFVFRHTGAQFEDDLNRDKLAAATTLDGFAAVPLTRQLQLTARAENLFDSQVVAGISSDGSIERATPRTLWLELRLNARGD
jgi:outer membrane receptor protein involved in Fe transport